MSTDDRVPSVGLHLSAEEHPPGDRRAGGRGKPCYGKLDTCVATRDAEARRIAHPVLCSADPEQHVRALRDFSDAGLDRVLVQQCGPDQEFLVALYSEEVLPRLGARAVPSGPGRRAW